LHLPDFTMLAFQHLLSGGSVNRLAPLVLALLVAAPAQASFHMARISGLLTSFNGDDTHQMVEIEMQSLGQNLVGESVLGTFDESGAFVDDFVVPSDVANAGAGVTWLMGSSTFVAGGLTDFVIDIPLPLAGGMVCWGAPGLVTPDPNSWDHTDPLNYVDCLAYGTYSGPTNAIIGTPTPLDASGHVIERVSDTNDNATDFACAEFGSATTNNGTSTSLRATTPCPSAACGDGVVDPGEVCDDGNTVAGDGCSADCLTAGFCPAMPDPACVDAEKGILKIDERKAGKEKLKAAIKKLSASTAPSDFGDPVTGSTAYALCIYDDADALVDELIVDRAGDACGTKGKACWKATKTGLKYKDTDAASDGVQKLATKSGPEKKGKLTAAARNNTKKAQNALPNGLTAALAGSGQATLQVRSSDAACFGAALTEVKRADADLFQAK